MWEKVHFRAWFIYRRIYFLSKSKILRLNLTKHFKECNTINFDKEISYSDYLSDWYVD